MRLRIYIPALLYAAAAAADAESLTVEGNRAFTTAEIEVAASAAGAFDLAGVRRLYLRAGYLDATFDLTEDASGRRLFVAEGDAYRIAALDLRNDTPLGRAAVERFVGAKAGDAPSPPDLHDGLVALVADLAGRGYLLARAGYALEDAGPARVSLRVWATAGRRYAAGDISFVGVGDAEERALRGELVTRPGSPLSERGLADDVLTVIDYYRERGYPEANARPHRFELARDYDEVNVAIVAEPGPRVVIRRLDIAGNRRTRDAVIRRELTFEPGDPYDLARLRASARRVYNLKYFKAEPTLELTDAAAGVLRLTVDEKPTYRVAGGLAYEPAQGETSAVVIGDVDLSLANLAGTGRELKGRYAQLTERQLDAALSWYEPWIGGVDLFARPQGDYRERALYRKLATELSLGTHPGLNLAVAGGGGYDRVWGHDASRKVKVLTWAEYDGRDYFTNPRRGAWAYGRAELGVKRFDADGFQTRVPRLTADGWFFRPTARAQVAAARLAAAAFFSDRPTLDEYYPLGGRANLRGFREEHFLTDRYVLATLEYRFLTGRDSRVFLFADGAYRRRGEPRLDEGLELSYGAGFRALTPVGLYGVDYGLAAGAGPLEGMLHITIEQEF